MNTKIKIDDAYKTIGEVARELNLVDEKTGHLQTHTIRYWETQFKQIKPIVRAGKRRYYSLKVFSVISTTESIFDICCENAHRKRAAGKSSTVWRFTVKDNPM